MITFKKINSEDLKFFRTLLGPTYVLVDSESLKDHSHDHTEDLSFMPEVVLRPDQTEQVQKIMAYCYDQNICVTPRGAGTGLSGGSLPVFGGVSLDMSRMNRILKIDEENLQVITEPGIITEVLQNTLEQHGLFYPVDPASRGSCFIGGNIAENSGGPRAVKYGTVKDYVLNLEVVLPNGDLLETGANTLKNATGYDLTHLIVGSEGTLGVVTKIVLKLRAFPKERMLMLAPFTSPKQACIAVNAILKAGIVPSALEFMERDALIVAEKYLGESPVVIPDHVNAHLLIEVDGQDQDELFAQMTRINEVLEPLTKEELYLAQTKQEQDKLWKLRRIVGEAAKGSSIYREEDTVVPRAYIPELLDFVKATGRKYGFSSICYGHTGDGNMHVNILKKDMPDAQWNTEIPKAIKEIFAFVKSKGGTISGEHGIGWVQKNYMPLMFSKTALQLMAAIKKVFDPKGILNPGKVLPN